jgi:benzoyl-CoA reductase subunit D
MVITAGIDMGSKNIKVVIVQDKKVLSKAVALGGFDPKGVAERLLSEALKGAGLAQNKIEQIIGTGAGVDMAPNPTSKVSMVGAMAKGAFYAFPSARTVIDVGAEDARAVKCDEKGLLVDFVVNDRCAAGAGAFIEAMSRALEVKLEEMGPMALKSEKAVAMNAQCAVFGESEVVSLVHQKTSKGDIARAIFEAMAERIASMVRRLGVNMDVVVIGGVAKDVGFVDALNRKLSVQVKIPEAPEFAGAIGAALSY